MFTNATLFSIRGWRLVNMSSKELIELIKRFKNQDMSAFSEIYDNFKNLINSYSYKLGGEDYNQELTVFLLELLYDVELSRFMDDCSDGLNRYILVSIRNKYYAMSREKQEYNNFLHNGDINQLYCRPTADAKLLIKEMLKLLSKKQRDIIIYKYIYGYSDTELGALLNISRQAVNRLKNRAVEAMYEYYINEELI